MDTRLNGPRVVIVTFDSAQILDVTGPLEVFSSASRFLPSVRYGTEVVSSRGGPVLASCGLEFASSPIAAVRAPIDTLLVAGGADMNVAVADDLLLHHVRRLAGHARRVTSVCSGAFVLAAAGLLDGRRATTHWADCAQLDTSYSTARASSTVSGCTSVRVTVGASTRCHCKSERQRAGGRVGVPQEVPRKGRPARG